MTNAHQRITLPPISSFDISPSRVHHTNYRAGPSRPRPQANGSSSWDGSSTGSNQARHDFELVDDLGPSSSRYDATLESSHYDHHDITSAHARLNHSPFSEPVDLVIPYEATPSAPRPRSSSAAVDRRGPVVPQVPHYRLHRIPQRLTCTFPRYPHVHLVPHGSGGSGGGGGGGGGGGYPHPAPHVSSREPSPDSRASFSRSPTDSPNAPTSSRSGTVPSPHATPTTITTTSTTIKVNTAGAGAVAVTAGGSRLPAQASAFIHRPSTLGTMGVTLTRRRTSPSRKRKASEMFGTTTTTTTSTTSTTRGAVAVVVAAAASPGSEERAVSPEPSESEAKKKYKKKMNVRHYRAQNKDAMTQLRDVLPEHMRPPERQAKAYVTLSAIKYIRELTAENERLRAENLKQARELADRRHLELELGQEVDPEVDPELSSTGKVVIPESHQQQLKRQQQRQHHQHQHHHHHLHHNNNDDDDESEDDNDDNVEEEEGEEGGGVVPKTAEAPLGKT